MKIKICILSFVFCFLALPVLAQDASTASEETLPDAGWTPASPFYFLEQFAENLNLWFTFNAEKRAEKALQYADEKLAELKLLAENKQERTEERTQKLIEQALGIQSKYQQRIEIEIGKAEKVGTDLDTLREKIIEGYLRHEEVLTRVFSQVPENAKKAIEKVIDGSNLRYQYQLNKFNEAQQKVLQNKFEQRVTTMEKVQENLNLQQQNKGEDDKIQSQQRVNQQEKVGNSDDSEEADDSDDSEEADDSETTDDAGVSDVSAGNGANGSDQVKAENGQKSK